MHLDDLVIAKGQLNEQCCRNAPIAAK